MGFLRNPSFGSLLCIFLGRGLTFCLLTVCCDLLTQGFNDTLLLSTQSLTSNKGFNDLTDITHRGHIWVLLEPQRVNTGGAYLWNLTWLVRLAPNKVRIVHQGVVALGLGEEVIVDHVRQLSFLNF